MRRVVAYQICAVLLCFLEAASAQQTQPPPRTAGDQLAIPPRVLPIGPQELLSLLPPIPPGWKVTTSQAANQVSSWLLTIAQRQIEAPAPANTAVVRPGNQNAAPMRTVFMLIDTGFDPSPAGAFADFTPSRGATVEKFFFQNFPVIKARSTSTSESLQILINQRFVLRVEAQNQPKDATLGWMQQIPFARYNVSRGTALTALPPEVVIRSVDELNPGNNHESKEPIGEHAPKVRR